MKQMRKTIITFVALSISLAMHGQTNVVKRQVTTQQEKNKNIKRSWRRARTTFYEGFAPVWDNDNLKMGYIDKTGKLVIPFKWKYANEFHEGLANVENFDGMNAFIDKKGKEVIPYIWKCAFDFSEGLAGSIFLLLQ